MTNRIFVLNDNNELIGMEEQQYDTEDLLQSLLANYPTLLTICSIFLIRSTGLSMR